MSGQEEQAMGEVFASNYIAPVGPFLEEFEQAVAQHLGVSDCVALASGTAALHLSLRCLDLEPGDEVFCSTLTFCASANPILYERATPFFIDSDAQTWNMDVQLLADAMRQRAERNRLPKAIVAVDIFGQCVDMDAILEIAGAYDVPVVDDAAEALGATYRNRPAGSAAWANVFSFNGNKIITSGGGGMLCSDDSEFIAKCRRLSTQARDPAPHYQHSELGYNYRMSNVAAAIGVRQLDVLPDRVRRKREIFATYQQLLGDLPGLEFMPEAPYGVSNRWLTVARIDQEQFGCSPDVVRLRLEAEQIEARPVWKPLHLQPVYQGAGCQGGAVAEEIFRQGLCLPSGTAMTDADLVRIATIVRDCHSASRPARLKASA